MEKNLLNLEKTYKIGVIANQCAHWCGNPPVKKEKSYEKNCFEKIC